MVTDPNTRESGPGFAEFVALMALMTSMVALSIDAMLPALAEMGVELGASSENATQMVVTMLLVGMAIGQRLRGHLSETVFRRVFFAGLLLVGLHLILKSVLR